MYSTTLYYVHDPMCSWCWGFDKTWRKVKKLLPESINVRYLLGGLAADSNEPMSDKMRAHIQANWQKIQKEIPNTQFNYNFWTQCTPQRSTHPACRAVIAAKNQHSKLELPMIKRIQQAYYLHAQNPSKDATLIVLADALKLDIKQFTQDLNAKTTQQQLMGDIALAQSMCVNSFPSLVLKTANTIKPITIDYNHPEWVLNQIST